LEKLGVTTIECASNGLEVWEIILKNGEQSFDIIFMDLNIPIMGGYECAQKIRKLETQMNWKPTVITVVTANCRKDDYDRILDSNGPIRANYIFLKPFSFQQACDLFKNLNAKEDTPLLSESASSKRLGSVLLIDDDSFNIKLNREFIQKQMISTITACNGRAGVEKFKQHHSEIKIVLMDCEMPIMNGFEATKQLRTLCSKNQWEQPLIFGLTGHTNNEIVSKCLDMGMDRVLHKPLSFSKLKEVLAGIHWQM